MGRHDKVGIGQNYKSENMWLEWAPSANNLFSLQGCKLGWFSFNISFENDFKLIVKL